MSFCDYIIYADESGSPVLAADREDFPVFVLVFMVVKKDHYIQHLVPAVQSLKFRYVGHDQLILHERDIRRQSGQFAFLQVNPVVRQAFMDDLTAIVESSDIEIISAVIDKAKLGQKYANPWSLYDLALTFCMEKAGAILMKKGQAGSKVNVVFEARGATEDRHLELEFRRIADGNPKIGKPTLGVSKYEWSPLFIDKRANSTGLQIADLAARPLGLKHLRPDQKNRAADVLRSKCTFPGPKVFP
ncbi:DUF3800 domain-containing protein [Cypionkella sp. TWP1-2-1b2]|uniref:DUF3800 domain-containing protein n=1 Tax=Cypionkella sp. TWP1-2-1b2 TaxID=2804675 RepID=UPI003CF6257D